MAVALAAVLPLALTAGCATGVGTTAGGSPSTTSTTDGVLVPDPTSVVVLEGRRDLDVVLSLGLPLRGFPYEEDGALDLPSPLAEELAAVRQEGAEPLFLADEVNVEAIAAAAPDLVVGRAEDAEPVTPQLEAFTTVLPIGDQTSSTWQEDLRLVAAATGAPERAELLVDAYEERVADIAEEYADVLAETTVAPVSINEEGSEIGVDRLLTTVLLDVGVTPSEAFAEALEEDEDVSFGPEQLLQAFGDADALVVLVNQPGTWDGVQADPLYQQLPAVQQGHVVRSDKQTHEGAALTAMQSLDVLEQLLSTVR
ncbi:ABC transporter substrate-binding protein [Pseudokineococcus sp. 1T1Z-3]|uniref:ABC transporter substrate-binding protein n=1 Tax=Pseudokineococcus sp. 1T1Z-3 TaxID=3132745 RepID=UPI00309A11B5